MNDLQARISDVLQLAFDGRKGTGNFLRLAAEIAAEVHPRIETIDQLDTLPHGAVVRASAGGPNGSVYEKDLQHTQRGEPWWPSGYDVECASDDIQLPAILLYMPEST